MTDPGTVPALEDPSIGSIEQTDNELRPEDGDQLIDGKHVSEYTDEELAAIGETPEGDDDDE